jgi:hypothetical protein
MKQRTARIAARGALGIVGEHLLSRAMGVVLIAIGAVRD